MMHPSSLLDDVLTLDEQRLIPEFLVAKLCRGISCREEIAEKKISELEERIKFYEEEAYMTREETTPHKLKKIKIPFGIEKSVEDVHNELNFSRKRILELEKINETLSDNVSDQKRQISHLVNRSLDKVDTKGNLELVKLTQKLSRRNNELEKRGAVESSDSGEAKKSCESEGSRNLRKELDEIKKKGYALELEYNRIFKEKIDACSRLAHVNGEKEMFKRCFNRIKEEVLCLKTCVDDVKEKNNLLRDVLKDVDRKNGIIDGDMNTYTMILKRINEVKWMLECFGKVKSDENDYEERHGDILERHQNQKHVFSKFLDTIKQDVLSICGFVIAAAKGADDIDGIFEKIAGYRERMKDMIEGSGKELEYAKSLTGEKDRGEDTDFSVHVLRPQDLNKDMGNVRDFPENHCASEETLLSNRNDASGGSDKELKPALSEIERISGENTALKALVEEYHAELNRYRAIISKHKTLIEKLRKVKDAYLKLKERCKDSQCTKLSEDDFVQWNKSNIGVTTDEYFVQQDSFVNADNKMDKTGLCPQRNESKDRIKNESNKQLNEEKYSRAPQGPGFY